VTDVPTVTAGESAWDKLRRRKVVQWGIVYAAGAWGLLQGLEYVTSTFDWPRQVQQLSTLALLVGLPVVLVTAWYHGDQGRQRVSAAELIIITLLFLVGGRLIAREAGQDVGLRPYQPRRARVHEIVRPEPLVRGRRGVVPGGEEPPEQLRDLGDGIAVLRREGRGAR